MLAPANAQPMAPAAPAPKYHDVTIVTKRTYACAKVEGVPPEEFGIDRNAKRICDANYCFHERARSQSDLIDEGYDEDQLKKLPAYDGVFTTEKQSRDTVDESLKTGDDGLNTAARLIRVTEHYIRMDYEGDGKACLYRVTTGGNDSTVLLRDGEEDIVKVDSAPFAAMTPFIMTHRFFGRSVADYVMDIQRIKTALMRGMLDNLYLHNNPRVEVAEAYASETTLDDLLVSRPGGIVRTKQPGGLNWQVVPDITASIYPAIQYMDATREWRTGVSRQGQGTDPNQLQNQVATIANQMFNAAQAKTKLIARIFAETGIKDLFILLHGIVRKNGSKPQTVRLRNQWVPIDPRDWKQRNDMTVNVGLGTGSKGEQLAHLQLIIGAQTQAVAVGLVSKKNLWESAKELTKLAGHKDHERFFTPPKPVDPMNPQGENPDAPLPPPPNPDVQKTQMEFQLKDKEAQNKAAIEQVQAQADIASNNAKLQNEAAMQERKFQFDTAMAEKEFELQRQLKMLEAHLAMEKHKMDMQSKTADHQMKSEEHQAARNDKENSGLKADKIIGDLGGVSDGLRQMHERMNHMEADAAAPVELIHDPKTKKVAKIRKGNREITIKRTA